MTSSLSFLLVFCHTERSEVSKNGKFSLPVIASEQSERGNPKSKNNAKFIDCYAVFAKTAHNDKRKKPKNKAFKNFKKQNALKNAFCKQKDEKKPR